MSELRLIKIHIHHNLREEPWGGGNQFLKALRDEWIRQGVYSESPESADIILINSYPFSAEYLFDELLRIKKAQPKKIVIYRLDGPISYIRQKDKDADFIIREWNRFMADGIIFQSRWCEEKNNTHFGIISAYQTVIHNAPDPNIFYRPKGSPRDTSRIKLIATSWSANPNKGFIMYEYLNTHLDFTKYEMTFVGNSPIIFSRIKMIKPVSSEELAPLLRAHDIFITASKKDPCSNSLIEALSCGLPAVALNDGGHPELIQKGGELFDGMHDILEKIDHVASNLSLYQNQLPVFDITKVAYDYFSFAECILLDVQERRYIPKRASRIGMLKTKCMVFIWKLKNIWNKLTGFFR